MWVSLRLDLFFASVCLIQVEKRLELVKQVSHSTHKKLTACLQGQQGVDVDKKSVRSPSVRDHAAKQVARIAIAVFLTGWISQSDLI